MKIVAIIPAAGRGERFGMPKVDANYKGITFAQRIISTLQEAGWTDYVLVRDIRTRDMQESIRLGMEKYLSEHERPDGWLIWPVDHPIVKASTITILASVYSEKRTFVIVPRFQGSNGHPIIVPGALTIPKEQNPRGLKGVIIESIYPILQVYVDDVGVLFNFNTPKDFTRV
jgi:CTP:molybdopterin cytidylyltransferase MocA